MEIKAMGKRALRCKNNQARSHLTKHRHHAATFVASSGEPTRSSSRPKREVDKAVARIPSPTEPGLSSYQARISLSRRAAHGGMQAFDPPHRLATRGTEYTHTCPDRRGGRGGFSRQIACRARRGQGQSDARQIGAPTRTEQAIVTNFDEPFGQDM
jgi:hypothetical protein